LRTLAGFLFFVTAGSRREAKNRISGQIKNVAEVSKQLGKIENRGRKSQIFSPTLGVPPEIRNRSGKLRSSAEKLNLSLKICDVCAAPLRLESFPEQFRTGGSA
jgi:hypothetical protein